MKAKLTMRVLAMVLVPALLALPSCGGDDDDDGVATDADTDADSDADSDADTDACDGIGPVAGDCEQGAEKTPAEVTIEAQQVTTEALLFEWTCGSPEDDLAAVCDAQPGLQCHFGGGVILIIRSQAAAEALDGICGPFPVPAEVDWEAQTLLVAVLSMGTCGYELESDWRFYSLDEGGLEAGLFIWNPENPFESDTCDSATRGSLAILADTTEVEAACLYDHPPCD